MLRRKQNAGNAASDRLRALETVNDALRRERDKAQGYLNLTGAMMVTLDPAGHIVEINRNGYALLGWEEGSLTGKNWFDTCLPPENQAPVRRELDALVAGLRKPDGTFENAVMTRSGEPRTILWHNAVLRDEKGVISGVLCSGIDVTERKRDESERERLSTAIDQAFDIVVITDVDGTIQYVNPAFERITGYSASEAIGQTPRILKSGRHDASFYNALWETILRGDTWHGRFRNRKKDGTLYEEEATISPVRGRHGAISSYVAVKRDVTIETALEGQLRHAQKMEAIGKLAGGIAHDFNNLLMVILNSADFILDELPSDSPSRDDVGEILAAGRRATALTRQLLTFSRKQLITPQLVDLNGVLRNLDAILKRLIPENIAVAVHPFAEVCMARVDTSQIEQIIVNMAVNARDAMPDGGRLTIELSPIRLERQVATELVETPHVVSGAFLMLSISDTGVGMDAATRERIFEPFFSTKPVGEGSGLGLSTAYGIIKQHGGYISVYSEVGRGSTFKVYLPEAPEGHRHSASEDVALPRGSETILVVEDDENVRAVTVKTLEKLGYNVLNAGNPQQAIELAERYSGDIAMLLTDLVMPGMDGAAVSKAVSKLRPGIAILIVSGYPEKHLVERGLTPEPCNLLQKPFTKQQIATTVRSLIDRQSAI